jgi:hypothetical protein
VLSLSDYSIVAKGAKDAQVAVVADGYEAGKVLHVKVNPPRPGGSGNSAAAAESAKRQEEKRNAQIEAERNVRRKILDEILARVKDVSRVDLEILLAGSLVADEELARLYGPDFKAYLSDDRRAELLAKRRDIEIYQMAVIAPLLSEFSHYRILSGKPELLLAAAKRYKVDAAKIRIQVETAAAKAKTATPPGAAATAAAKKGASAKAKPAKVKAKRAK